MNPERDPRADGRDRNCSDDDAVHFPHADTPNVRVFSRGGVMTAQQIARIVRLIKDVHESLAVLTEHFPSIRKHSLDRLSGDAVKKVNGAAVSLSRVQVGRPIRGKVRETVQNFCCEEE